MQHLFCKTQEINIPPPHPNLTIPKQAFLSLVVFSLRMARTPASSKVSGSSSHGNTKVRTADRVLARLRMLHAQASEDMKRDIETVIRDVTKLSSRNTNMQTLIDAVREMTDHMKRQQENQCQPPKKCARKARVVGPDAIMKRALFEVYVKEGMSIGVPLRSKIIKHTDSCLKDAIKSHVQQSLQHDNDGKSDPPSPDELKASTVEFIRDLESTGNADVVSALHAVRDTLHTFHRMKVAKIDEATQYGLVEGCMTLLRDPTKYAELNETPDANVGTQLKTMIGEDATQ